MTLPMHEAQFTEAPTSGLVTVVIPTYRADDYIGEALATVSRQKYADWELVVVEDASQGKTEGIVKQFAADHPQHRVVYLRNDKNSGPSHSRNVAFQRAQGEFIALLDADDRWFESHLAACVQSLRENAADIAYSTVVMIEDGTDQLVGLWGPDRSELEEFPHGLFSRNTITPSATVLRRSAIADVGLWATNLRLCEDLDYWLRCLAKGKKFAFVGGCHCLYRQNRAEAATKNKCAVQESVARIAEGYIGLPCTREAACRNRVSIAYAQAARLHRKGDRRKDPSCDPRRISSLLMKAWQLQPRRVDFLARAAWRGLLNSFRTPAPSPIPPPVSLQKGLA